MKPDAPDLSLPETWPICECGSGDYTMPGSTMCERCEEYDDRVKAREAARESYEASGDYYYDQMVDAELERKP